MNVREGTLVSPLTWCVLLPRGPAGLCRVHREQHDRGGPRRRELVFYPSVMLGRPGDSQLWLTQGSYKSFISIGFCVSNYALQPCSLLFCKRMNQFSPLRPILYLIHLVRFSSFLPRTNNQLAVRCGSLQPVPLTESTSVFLCLLWPRAWQSVRAPVQAQGPPGSWTC